MTNPKVRTVTSTSSENSRKAGQHVMQSPPIVSQQEWGTAREQMLVREKAFTRVGR